MLPEQRQPPAREADRVRHRPARPRRALRHRRRARSSSELGWRPRHNFEDGLRADRALVPRQSRLVGARHERRLSRRAARAGELIASGTAAGLGLGSEPGYFRPSQPAQRSCPRRGPWHEMSSRSCFWNSSGWSASTDDTPDPTPPRRGDHRSRGLGIQGRHGQPRWRAGARSGLQQRIPNGVDLRRRPAAAKLARCRYHLAICLTQYQAKAINKGNDNGAAEKDEAEKAPGHGLVPTMRSPRGDPPSAMA